MTGLLRRTVVAPPRRWSAGIAIAAVLALAGLLWPVAAHACYTVGCRASDLDREVIGRIASAIEGRRADRPVVRRSGEPHVALRRGSDPSAAPDLAALFARAVPAVPLVLTVDGLGSGVVTSVDRAASTATVVTNDRVVSTPFRTSAGVPVVVVIFYDEHLWQRPVDRNKLTACLLSQAETDGCGPARQSIRVASVDVTDAGRGLALLRIRDVPPQVAALPEAEFARSQTGEPVVVFGHPRGSLWTLTAGVISGVRDRLPGEARGTVIQTRTPVMDGTRGSPLLTADGRLLGVVSSELSGQGFNAAIGLEELRAFVRDAAKPAR